MNARLIKRLDQLGSPKILVLGDLMLDRYAWGRAERVSPEAPALVLRCQRREARLGGAAGATRLLAALGARAAAAGVVGRDAAGRRLRALLQQSGADRRLVLADPQRRTTVKERLLARVAGRRSQQLLRADYEDRRPLSRRMETTLLQRVIPELSSCRALLVSDYGKGVCSRRLLAGAIAAAAHHNLPVLVDPARGADWDRYRYATAAAPNRLEAQQASGLPVTTTRQALQAGRALRRRYGLEAVFVTLDRQGLAMAERGDRTRVFPAATRRAADVTGAGDMVLAMAGLCLASGASPAEAAELANAAAGLEVEKLGSAPVTRRELRARLAAARGVQPDLERTNHARRPLGSQPRSTRDATSNRS